MNSMSPEEALRRAQTAFRMGEYVLARGLLEKLRERDPENPFLCNLLGDIYEREGRYDKAIALFQKIIRMDGNNVEAYNNLGVAYKNQGNTEKALAAFMKVVQLDPRRADVYYNLGNLYKDLNQPKTAIGFYRKALENDPNYILAYNNLGTVLESEGRYDEALQVYHRGLQIDSHNVRLHYNSGILYKHKGRLKEAEAEFRLALKYRPGFIEAKNNLALILQNRGECERARVLFHEILKTDPANAEAHNNLGVVLAEENIVDGARHHYEQALRINPHFRKARLNLALLKASTESPSAALEELAHLLRDDPDDIEAHGRAGLLSIEEGRWDEAEAHFRAILDRDPVNCEALRGLGRIHLNRGRIEQALHIRSEIQKIDRENVDFTLDVAFYYKERGEYEKAEEELRSYLSHRPGHMQAGMILADVLLSRKQHDAAQALLSEMLGTGKREPEILLMLARLYKEKGMQEEVLHLLYEIIEIQGSSDAVGQAKKLAETLAFYEETVNDYESRFKDQLKKNLMAYKTLYSVPEREIIPSDDVIFLDKKIPLDDSIPIINVGGREPVFEIREEEEEIHLEEHDERIESGAEEKKRIVEIEGQGAPSLLNLLDGEQLYEESPSYERKRRDPPFRKRQDMPREEAPKEADSFVIDEPSSSFNPPLEKPINKPPHAAMPSLTNAWGAEALHQLTKTVKDAIESMGQSIKGSLFNIADGRTVQNIPSPPVILFAPTSREAGGGQKETPVPSEGDRIITASDEPAPDKTGEREAPAKKEDDGSSTRASPPEEMAELEAYEESEDAYDGKEAQGAGELNKEKGVLLEEVPEELMPEMREEETLKNTSSLEAERKTPQEDVRGLSSPLDVQTETSVTFEKARSGDGASRRISDYLANIEMYLPHEPRFKLIENEMHMRMEALRRRLSGKPGLVERIESTFPGLRPGEDVSLTNKNLISTFSFMKGLSEFMSDRKLSMLLRKKIDGILGKMRGVSVK